MGLAPSEWDDTQAINDKMQLTDQQNIKCSIEIKNGIPQRSLNNFHKNQNALVLNNYTVSGPLLVTQICERFYVSGVLGPCNLPVRDDFPV